MNAPMNDGNVIVGYDLGTGDDLTGVCVLKIDAKTGKREIIETHVGDDATNYLRTHAPDALRDGPRVGSFRLHDAGMQNSDDFKDAERKAMTQQPFTIGHLDGGVKFYVYDDIPPHTKDPNDPRNRHERRVARARARRKQPPGKRRR